MGSIPLPALALQQPQQQLGPLDQYSKVMQLKNMLAQQQTQQQLAPLQVQQAQNEVSRSGTEAQSAALDLKDKQGFSKVFDSLYAPAVGAKPQATSQAAAPPAQPGAASAQTQTLLPALPGANGQATPVGAPSPTTPAQAASIKIPSPSGDRFQNLLDAVQSSPDISPTGKMSFTKQVLEMQTAQANKTKAETEAQQAVQSQIAQGLESVLSAAPEDQPYQYGLKRNELLRNDNPAVAQAAQKLSPQFPGTDQLTQSAQSLAMSKDFGDYLEQSNKKAALPGVTANSEKDVQEAALGPAGRAATTSPELQAQAAWLAKNPGKDASDYQIMMKKLIPAYNFNLQGGQGGGLNNEALDQAAQRYAQTGVLPAMGMGSAGAAARKAIMNRAGELAPNGSIAANSAEYAANENSLKNLQKNFDQVTAFENTAGKNLDQFLSTTKGLVDSGSPIVNTPLRLLSDKVAGSANMAAVNAARTTALTEISKVLNSSNASGVLSDSARNEVSSLIGKDATLKQIYSAAGILKKDMGNRHDAYADQIADIQKRLSGSSSSGSQSSPQNNSSDPFAQFGGKAHPTQ